MRRNLSFHGKTKTAAISGSAAWYFLKPSFDEFDLTETYDQGTILSDHLRAVRLLVETIKGQFPLVDVFWK
jgi:hypothetical protein